MIDNTLAINAYNNANIDNAIKKSEQFKTNFKAEREMVNGIDTKALREQTDAFEAFFVKMVLDISTKQENPLFGKDASDEIYHSMYTDTMSRALSGGFGFSDMIYDYLLQRAK